MLIFNGFRRPDIANTDSKRVFRAFPDVLASNYAQNITSSAGFYPKTAYLPYNKSDRGDNNGLITKQYTHNFFNIQSRISIYVHEKC